MSHLDLAAEFSELHVSDRHARIDSGYAEPGDKVLLSLKEGTDFWGFLSNQGSLPPEIAIQLAPPSRQASFEPRVKHTGTEGGLSPQESIKTRSSMRSRLTNKTVDSGYESAPEQMSEEQSWRNVTSKDLSHDAKSGYVSSPENDTSGRGGHRPPRFQCSLCHMNFTQAYVLSSHLRTHTKRASVDYSSNPLGGDPGKGGQPRPATFQCTLCPNKFTRAYNLRSHMRTHADEKPFVCCYCEKAFAHQLDRQQHETLHAQEGSFVCGGYLKDGGFWGCGHRFGQADALSHHFRSEVGGVCIRPALEDGSDQQGMDTATLGMKLLVEMKKDLASEGRLSNSGGLSLVSDVGNWNKEGETPEQILTNPDISHALDSGTSSMSNLVMESIQFRFGTDPTARTKLDEVVETNGAEASSVSPSTQSTASHASMIYLPDDVNMEFRRHLSHSGDDATAPPARVCQVYTHSDEDESSSSELSDYVTDSENSFYALSPNTSELEAIFAPVVEKARRATVERLMSEVHTLLDQQALTRSRASGSETSQPRSPPSENRISVSLKRSSTDGSTEEDVDDVSKGNDKGNDEPRKKARPLDTFPNGLRRKLACPFYQRNPFKHQAIRSCAGPGWPTIHRIKEHVYRRHALPIRCNRCQDGFPNDAEFVIHQRLPENCPLRQADPIDGLSKAQEQELRKRKKTTLSEEDKWKEMYRILFPDDSDEDIPSPFYSILAISSPPSWPDQLAAYERYLSRELPRLIRTRLDTVFAGSAAPLEDQLRSQLVDLVRNCQSELFRSYHQPGPDSSTVNNQDLVPTPPSAQISANETDLLLEDLSAWFAPPTITDAMQSFSGSNLEQTFAWNGSMLPSSDSGNGTQTWEQSGSGFYADENFDWTGNGSRGDSG